MRGALTRTDMLKLTANAWLWFPKGDYEYALECYFRTKTWCESTGGCFKSGLSGRLQAPRFKGREPPSPIPREWLDEREWECQMLMHIDAPLDLQWLRNRIMELPLPVGATLEIMPV